MNVYAGARPTVWWQWPWWALSETGIYLLVAGFVAILLTLLIAIIVLGLSRGRWDQYGQRVGQTVVLLWGAVVVGVPANLVFTAWLRHRYYVPADPMADWVPFFPSGSWILDVGSGGHFVNGGTEALLWCAWGALAIPVWAFTWAVHRRLLVTLQRAFHRTTTETDAS